MAPSRDWLSMLSISALPLLSAHATPLSTRRPSAHVIHSVARSPRAPFPRLGPQTPDDAPSDADELSAAFFSFVAGEEEAFDDIRGFNEDLYAHLHQRPEYENSELYKNLRKRVDVTDPMYKELEQVKWGDLLVDAGPSPETTPGEAIETILRALRDVDEPQANHGLELLQSYSSTACAVNEKKTTPQQVRDYFESSKYQILFNWVAIRYTRKLELSYDKKRAVQQLRLKGRDGTSVPVTFQLSSYKTDKGDVWLVDQLLVKSVDE